MAVGPISNQHFISQQPSKNADTSSVTEQPEPSDSTSTPVVGLGPAGNKYTVSNAVSYLGSRLALCEGDHASCYLMMCFGCFCSVAGGGIAAGVSMGSRFPTVSSFAGGCLAGAVTGKALHKSISIISK